MMLNDTIGGVGTLFSAVICWLLLGAILSLFISPGWFGLSAFIIASIWLSDDRSSCPCEPYEPYYSE